MECYAPYFLYLMLGRTRIPALGYSRHFRELENKTFPLPPLAEQRKIAEIIRTWDEAIEAAEAELKAKQERKRWLAMSLISGELRLSGCSGKREKVRLADLFERVMQKNEELCERCLTISAEKGLVDQREYFDRRISSADTSGYFLMKRGDFAYNRSYSNGYPYGVVKRLNAYDVGTVTTLYLVFTPKEGVCDPLYMEHVFDSGLLNKGLRTIVQEGARAHGLLNVKAEDFFSLSVQIPGKDAQAKISKLLCDAQKQVSESEARLHLLRTQKRGLMQKLLTGEVRVAA
jgi:type I restriction enzyme S subunit